MVKLVNLLEVKLLENKRTYEAMMKPLYDVADLMKDTLGIDTSQAKADAADKVNRLRKALRRSDNIVWAIQYVRLLTLDYILNPLIEYRLRNDPDDPKLQQIAEHIAKVRRSFTKSLVKATNNHESPIDFDVVLLEHYGSYMDPTKDNYIPQMAEMSFTGKTFNSVIYALDHIEDEWKRNMDKVIRSKDDKNVSKHEVLIQFPDGSRWINLHVPECDLEGRAMGHCGNSYRNDPKYEVLSYRTPSNEYGAQRNGDDTDHWVPHLTFVLDTETGTLVEAKGRANNKPDHKYDRVVVELLKLPLIRWISYSGHKPENNFNPKELDDSLKEELISSRPDFKPLAFWSWELTNNNDAYEALIQEFVQYEIPTPDGTGLIDGNRVLVSTEDVDYVNPNNYILKNILSLYKIADEDVDDVMSMLSEIKENLVSETEIPQDTIWNALYDMDDETIGILAEEFGVSSNQKRIPLIDDLVYKINKRSEIFEDIIAEVPLKKLYDFTQNDVAEIFNNIIAYANPNQDFDIYLDSETDSIETFVELDNLVESMHEFIDNEHYEHFAVTLAKQNGSWDDAVSEEVWHGPDTGYHLEDSIPSIASGADTDFERAVYGLIENTWDITTDVESDLAPLYTLDIVSIDSRDVRDAILEYIGINESIDEFEAMIYAIMEQAL